MQLHCLELMQSPWPLEENSRSNRGKCGSGSSTVYAHFDFLEVHDCSARNPLPKETESQP